MEQKINQYINKEDGVKLNSSIIKTSMGFDVFPIDNNSGISYNLKIDGNKMNDKIPYVLKNDKLDLFLSDLEKIEKNCNITGINIKNIFIDNNANLNSLLNIFKKIKRINIENSHIPNLKRIILQNENKNYMELINIINSELNPDDIDKNEFENIYYFNIENNIEGIKEENASSKTKEVFPWYKKLLEEIKKWPIIKDMSRKKIKTLSERK